MKSTTANAVCACWQLKYFFVYLSISSPYLAAAHSAAVNNPIVPPNTLPKMNQSNLFSPRSIFLASQIKYPDTVEAVPSIRLTHAVFLMHTVPSHIYFV